MNTPTLHDGMVVMPRDEFEELLERAAERGSRHALADVGLDGPEAAHDRLEAKGSFKVTPGTKVVAQVNLASKATTARFVLK